MLRSLQFAFPDCGRNYYSKASEASPTLLKGLPHLKSLTFEVYVKIPNSQITLPQKIRDSCQHGCQIKLDIRKTDEGVAEHSRHLFQVRIGPSALRKMQEWDWNISGKVIEDDRWMTAVAERIERPGSVERGFTSWREMKLYAYLWHSNMSLG